jgi:hypothetical protein
MMKTDTEYEEIVDRVSRQMNEFEAVANSLSREERGAGLMKIWGDFTGADLARMGPIFERRGQEAMRLFATALKADLT